MIEKQVIIDIKEYEELQEWAEAGYDATEAIKKVIESGNPNEKCRTILLENGWEGQDTTRICICTNDEVLKKMDDSHTKKIKELTERGDAWKNCFIKIQEENDKLRTEMKQKNKRTPEENRRVQQPSAMEENL